MGGFLEDFVPLALDFDSSRSICVVAGSQDKIISLKVDHLDKSLTVLTERTLPSKGISRYEPMFESWGHFHKGQMARQ